MEMLSKASARRFKQVDVFTQRPLLGNPVAVLLDSEGLSAEQMLRFTRWTRLSEATFLSPPRHPKADYALRIFDPCRELPFAGHPTLGSCHAWLEAGGTPKGDEIIQECAAGLVRIRRERGGALAFAAPPLLKSGPLSPLELSEALTALSIEPSAVRGHQWCDNGPGWRALLLDSAARLHALKPRDPHCQLDLGVIAPSDRAGCDFEVRAFFPGEGGFTEDPVTGSLNAALAEWLIGAGLAPPRYTVHQGHALGREGVVRLSYEGRSLWVEGDAVTVLNGAAQL